MKRTIILLLPATLLAHCSSGSDAGQAEPKSDSGAEAASDAAAADADGKDAATPPEDLASALEPIRAAHELPALAAAVWRGDELIARGVTGVRKLGDPTPATNGDRWHLGSDTKAMTATLIGVFVDRGALQFEATIGELFSAETVDPGYASVTIRQLLEHRGGAPATIPSEIWAAMWENAPDARIQAVRALIALPPEQAPGSFVYSNAGYIIAGAALERVSGKSWEELMLSDLFTPLGMSSCGFGAPGDPSLVDEPWGHDTTATGVTPLAPGPLADNPPALGPAGTVHCSLADWGKFLAVHLHGARKEPVALVTQATLDLLQTPTAGGDYAAGWGVTDRTWAGGLALTHSGSNTLWFATAWIAPAKNLGFVAVTNRGDESAATAVDEAFAPMIERYAN